MKPTTKRKPTKVTTTEASKRQMKGFAVMKPAQRSKIASMGGLAVSKNRKHMALIGAAGGRNSHRNTNSKGN